MIKIITDSTAYIKKEFAEKNDIDIIPLSVTFLNETAPEGYPGEFESFYEKLKASDDFPKTSQPSIGMFVSSFEKAIKDNREVIAILISSKLSGTYSTALAAAEIVGSDKITIIDSETTVDNLKTLVVKAVNLAKSNLKRKEIEKIIEDEKKKMGIRLTVDTLDYLKKGGRLSSSKALIGTILNIKPIIGLIDGELIPLKKVRGKKNAIDALVSEIPKDVKKLSICHILNLKEAEELKSRLEISYPGIEIGINDIGPVIGSHLGPGALGICYSW